jgi:hypothetical protein
MARFGLLDQLISDGRAISLESNPYSSFVDGEPIATRPGSAWAIKHFGFPW